MAKKTSSKKAAKKAPRKKSIRRGRKGAFTGSGARMKPGGRRGVTKSRDPYYRRGPHAKKIDYELVEEMAEANCTVPEIAVELGINAEVLKRQTDFREAYFRGQRKGDFKLRDKQYKLAIGGDRTMLIWLGKQRLGQTDRAAHEVTGPQGGPVQVITADLSKLSMPELKQLEKLLDKVEIEGPPQIEAGDE